MRVVSTRRFSLYVTVKLLLFFAVSGVLANSGILSVQIESRDTTQTKEYCIAYDQQASLPKTLEDKDYHQLVDFSQSTLCTTPEDPSSISGAVVEALRGNCTFLQKGLLAQEAGARSLLVISSTKITTPSVNQSTELKIPVALIAASDHEDIWATRGQVRAALYSPDPPVFDFNLILIWAMALMTVVIGGYWSGLTAYLVVIKKQKKEERRAAVAADRGARSSEESDSDTESEEEPVTITVPIVVIWVIMIMVMLLLLFFFYDYMVYVVIAFYCLGATNGLHTCLFPILKHVMPCKQRLPANKIPFLRTRPYIFSLVLALVCAACVACWFVYRHESFAWILLDLLGIAFCISVLRLIQIPNFKVCFILLVLLFLYDIFFVFITPLFTKDSVSVMVQAATGGSGATEQIPVLLQVPRLSPSTGRVCQLYSMLGFGDILVPGLLVGYCCSFDLRTHSRIKAYYITSCVAYGVGLIITFVALALMQTGQPALLYLVPCTVLTALALAAIRRELSDFWHARHSKLEPDCSSTAPDEVCSSVNTSESSAEPNTCSAVGDKLQPGLTPTASSEEGNPGDVSSLQDHVGESNLEEPDLEIQPLLSISKMPVT